MLADQHTVIGHSDPLSAQETLHEYAQQATHKRWSTPEALQLQELPLPEAVSIFWALFC